MDDGSAVRYRCDGGRHLGREPALQPADRAGIRAAVGGQQPRPEDHDDEHDRDRAGADGHANDAPTGYVGDRVAHRCDAPRARGHADGDERASAPGHADRGHLDNGHEHGAGGQEAQRLRWWQPRRKRQRRQRRQRRRRRIRSRGRRRWWRFGCDHHDDHDREPPPHRRRPRRLPSAASSQRSQLTLAPDNRSSG